MTAGLTGCSGGGSEGTTTEPDGTTDKGGTDQIETEIEDGGPAPAPRYGHGSHSPTPDFQNNTGGEVTKVTRQLHDTLIDFEPD